MVEGETVMTEYKKERFQNTRGVTYKAEAILLADYVTKPDREGRWWEAELWETRAGNWIAVNRNCSDHDGEEDLQTAVLIERSDDDMTNRIAAMDAWSWSTSARMIARKLKWKFVVEVA